MRNMKKGALLAALSTTVVFGGCLGGGLWKLVGTGLATSAIGSAADAYLWNGLFIGQDVTNALAYGAALNAACDGATGDELAACNRAFRP